MKKLTKGQAATVNRWLKTEADYITSLEARIKELEAALSKPRSNPRSKPLYGTATVVS
jgi:hypothetical protein